VRDDRVAAPALDRLDRTLEPAVGERLHLAARIADEVVVVICVPGRLVARDAVAELDALHERLLRECVEHPVDARETHAVACGAQRLVNFLRPAAAALCSEVLEDERPGRPGAVAGPAQVRACVLGPHVVADDNENRYRSRSP